VKLSELKIIDAALGASAGQAKAIVQGYIRQLEAKANNKVAAWNAWAPSLGLKKEDLGRIVTLRGTRYQIAGVNPGARKNAIAIVRVHDKKEFRCSPHYIIGAA
jgi:hypothetical protein